METHSLIERDLAVLSQADNYLALQMSKVRPFLGKRILEIGAGIGTHTDQILQCSPEMLVSLERSPEFCGRLLERFGKRVNVVCADLDRIDESFHLLNGYRFDTIVAINVMEHVESDLECMRILSRCLDSGGRMVLLMPASRFLYSKLDRKYGHHRRYDLPLLKTYSSSLGLDLERGRYFNMVGWFGWLLFARLLGADHIQENSFGLFERLLPLFNRVEEALPRVPFGLGLLAVLKKSTAA
jgi:phospholipid N-methyltransferase